MRNIWQIFIRDARRIRNNVIALIVIMGIIVVPCLYAWFNIAASWDPYNNTDNLKVAVASVDEGYQGSLVPIEVNIGERVLTSLHENTQMEWVFTSKENAINGVKSSDYYAAIVIPEDFSRNMMSIFSEDETIEKAKIHYYCNAKDSAIAPKVTEKGASAIQNQINQMFISTVADTALTVMESVANMTDVNDAESIVSNLIANLNRISNSLSSSAGTMDSFSGMTDSIEKMTGSTSDFLGYVSKQSSGSSDSISDIQKTFKGINKTITGTTDGINKALESGISYYKQMSQVIDTAFEKQAGDVEAVASTLETVADSTDSIITKYTILRDELEALGEKYPDIKPAVSSVVAKLNTSIAKQTALRDDLRTSAKELRSGAKDLATAKKEIDALLSKSVKGISKVKADYEKNVMNDLKSLSSSLSKTGSSMKKLLSQLDKSVTSIKDLTDTATEDLQKIRLSLDTSGKLLNKASGRVDDLVSKLEKMQQTGDFSELKDLFADKNDELSAFLAKPVSLKTTKVYEIENYGSSMAPFYSTLAIWIGGIIMVALMSVAVPASALEGLSGIKNNHLYLGRYLTFLILGLAQSSLIGLGDLFYLGIQCRHPFLFMLACWISSIVYVNIIYTLTVSFGDIGKAISVVLLVIQVAGTGGTFPIEVAPRFFRIVYPMLPFTHSMAALRETVGGLYGMDYWLDLAKLGIFLVLSLILGLVLRKPVIRLNNRFSEKLEETKVM